MSYLSKRFQAVRELWQEDKSSFTLKFDHCYYMREYCLTASTKILINCIIGALQGTESHLANAENAELCEEICKLAENDAVYHKPLGSMCVEISVGICYVGSTSAEQKERIARLSEDYASSFVSQPSGSASTRLAFAAKYFNLQILEDIVEDV